MEMRKRGKGGGEQTLDLATQRPSRFATWWKKRQTERRQKQTDMEIPRYEKREAGYTKVLENGS